MSYTNDSSKDPKKKKKTPPQYQDKKKIGKTSTYVIHGEIQFKAEGIAQGFDKQVNFTVDDPTLKSKPGARKKDLPQPNRRTKEKKVIPKLKREHVKHRESTRHTTYQFTGQEDVQQRSESRRKKRIRQANL